MSKFCGAVSESCSSNNGSKCGYLTRAEASASAQVSMKTIDRAVESGELPVADYVSTHPRFREADVYAWIERRKTK